MVGPNILFGLFTAETEEKIVSTIHLKPMISPIEFVLYLEYFIYPFDFIKSKAFYTFKNRGENLVAS